MKKIALFPGSFDPITKGHEDVIRRALDLFDEIIVAVGMNSTKQRLFSPELSMSWISKTFEDLPSVRVVSYSGLTIDLCKDLGARYMLRGVRSVADFEYERNIAQMNRQLNPDVETILLFTDPRFAAINSSIVREIYKHKGDVSSFLPEGVDLPH